MSILRFIAPVARQSSRPVFFHTSARVMYAYPLDKNGKPLNAFMKFTKEKRADIVRNNPELKVTEIARKVGELWKGLTDSERASYQEEAKRELEAFKSRL